MPSSSAADRYLIITSDAHGGAPMADYKPYLERRWHDHFDTWLAGVIMPWVDVDDASNWDSDLRLANMDADGVSGEIVFPNTLPPFFDILAHLSGVPRGPETFERKWAGLQAHNRWLVDFCRQAPLRRRGIVQLLPNDIDAAVAEIRWAAARPGSLPASCSPRSLPTTSCGRTSTKDTTHCGRPASRSGSPCTSIRARAVPDVGADEPVGRSIFFTELDLWTRRTMHHLIVGGVFERHPDLQVVWTEMWGLRWVVEELAHITLRLQNVQSACRRCREAGAPNYQMTFGSADGRRPLAHAARVLPPQLLDRGEHAAPPRGASYCGCSVPTGSCGARILRTRKGRRRSPRGACGPRCSTWRSPTAGRCSVAMRPGSYGFDLEALAPLAARIGPRVDEVARPLEQPAIHAGVVFARENPLEVLLS